jgi:hypothetical protein
VPAYGALPERIVGPVADLVRDATMYEHRGELPEAIALYEEAIAESLRHRPELPGFACGRLAALLRRAKRYRDEVELLERYRASQTEDMARVRLDARLSKARILAERHRQDDCGALASVRGIKKSKFRQSRQNAAPSPEPPMPADLPR